MLDSTPLSKPANLPFDGTAIEFTSRLGAHMLAYATPKPAGKEAAGPRHKVQRTGQPSSPHSSSSSSLMSILPEWSASSLSKALDTRASHSGVSWTWKK